MVLLVLALALKFDFVLLLILYIYDCLVRFLDILFNLVFTIATITINFKMEGILNEHNFYKSKEFIQDYG